jgi:hypothetical protein
VRSDRLWTRQYPRAAGAETTVIPARQHESDKRA